jgi:hypothetical protein
MMREQDIGTVKTAPFASVKYISSTKALVKVGIIDSWTMLKCGARKVFRELSFSFFAIGPIR